MNNRAKLNEDEVKKALNINSFREINKEKVFELIEMSGALNKETYLKIIEQVPNFVTIAKEYTQVAIRVVEESKELSKQTKEILKEISNNVNELLKKDNLDKEQKTQLIELLCKLVEVMDKCDERDKNRFLEILKMAFDFGKTVVMAVAVVLGAKYFRGKKF